MKRHLAYPLLTASLCAGSIVYIGVADAGNTPPTYEQIEPKLRNGEKLTSEQRRVVRDRMIEKHRQGTVKYCQTPAKDCRDLTPEQAVDMALEAYDAGNRNPLALLSNEGTIEEEGETEDDEEADRARSPRRMMLASFNWGKVCGKHSHSRTIGYSYSSFGWMTHRIRLTKEIYENCAYHTAYPLRIANQEVSPWGSSLGISWQGWHVNINDPNYDRLYQCYFVCVRSSTYIEGIFVGCTPVAFGVICTEEWRPWIKLESDARATWPENGKVATWRYQTPSFAWNAYGFA